MASAFSTTDRASMEGTQPSTTPINPSHAALASDPSSHLDSAVTEPKQNRYSAIDSSSNPTNPLSAFYQHPNTRSSLERAKAESRLHLPPQQLQPVDLERGTVPNEPKLPAIIVTDQPGDSETSTSIPPSRKTSTDGGSSRLMAGAGPRRPDYKTSPSQNSVWPTRRELEEKALMLKREQMRRNWNCLGGLSRKQRIWVRVLIGFLVLASSVGIGIGVSIAVGGGVYTGDGQQANISNGG